MVDSESVMIAYLKTKAVWGKVGGRIHAGYDLPAGYTPAQGAAMLLSERSRNLRAYHSQTMDVVMQVAIYGLNVATIRQASRWLYEDLNERYAPQIASARFSNGAAAVPTGSNGWLVALDIYNLILLNR